MSSNRFPPQDHAGDSYDWHGASNGQKSVTVDVWHGSGRRFHTFDNRFCGSGEGDSHGYGHYVTTNSRAAEKYARYDAKINGTDTPILYRCDLRLDTGRVINAEAAWGQSPITEDSPLRRSLNPAALQALDSSVEAAMRELKEEFGPHGARDLMHNEWGVQALYAITDSAPTFIVLDGSHLLVREVWEWQARAVDDHKIFSWNQTGGANHSPQQKSPLTAPPERDRVDFGF